MRTDIEKKRKELKAPLLAHGKLIDQTAKNLTARLLPTEQNLDEKIKARESIAEAAKAERLAAEKARLDAIQAKIAGIGEITAKAQEYGLKSEEIREFLIALKDYPVAEDVFQEFTEDTQATLERDIEIVTAALNRTLQFEADQIAQAELEAKNKAEADRLVKIAKDQEEARLKAEVEKEKADAKAKAKREAEEAKIVQERKALEDEKSRIARESAKNHLNGLIIKWSDYADELQGKYDAMRDDALAMNATYDQDIHDRCKEAYILQIANVWDEAHKIDADIDKLLAATAKEEAARLEALKPDKEKLIAFAKIIGEIKLPELQTDEGNQIAKLADALLRDCVDEIMAGIEAL